MEGRFPRLPVAEVATPVLGGTPGRSVSRYWGGHIKWAAAKDIVNAGGRYLRSTAECITKDGLDNSAAKLLPRGTVVITARGTVGALAQLGEDMTFNQTCYALVAKDSIVSDFLYYALRYSFAAMRSLSYGTVFDTITTKTFDYLPIPVPPLPEQHAIAAILGMLDDKIELNRGMNETLEAMARALFKSWFVDFEPFRNQGMQDSPLGPIPKGWQCITVAQAVNINPLRRLERGRNAIYVDMSALPTASARVLEMIRRPFSGSGSRFTNGDVLLARITPCLENGKTAVVDFLEDGNIGWGSTEFIVLGPKPPLGMPFIYCLARHPDFRAHAIQAMTGTSGRQRVDPGCFDHYWLAVPPAPVAQQFQEKVSPWFQKMKANDDESHVLASIRDTLLPKLLSGEIRVKDAERFVEAQI